MVFRAVVSIPIARKKLHPPDQPDESSDKSQRRERNEKPRRCVKISVEKIADRQATYNGAWKFESNS
jgi:hypothetical protein